MLYSLVVQLIPERDVVLPATLGHYAHAALFKMVEQGDGEVARRAHEERGEKPFTVSPLQGELAPVGKGQVRLRAGGEFWLRFTFLSDELYQAVSRFFLETPAPTLRLEKGRFVVSRVTATSSEASKWGGHATFSELWEAAQARARVSMRFFSPTCFRVTAPAGGARNLTEPSLRHCVQSWLRRWNRFAPPHLFLNPERLLDFVEAHGQLRRAQVEVHMFDFGTYYLPGFVGHAEWMFRCSPREVFDDMNTNPMRAEFLFRELDALARFAFYCGTGHKTTMGMGQSRRA